MTEKKETRTQRALRQVDRVKITPAQARNAAVTGQVGTAAGSLAGTTIGAAAGAIARKPSSGAFLGAGIGAALGGGGGAAAGLYSARPGNKKLNRPKMSIGDKDAQDPVTIKPKKKAPGPANLSKAFDESKHKRDKGKFTTTNKGMSEAPGSKAVKRPFMTPEREKQVATGLLGLSGVANVAALKASYKETKNAGSLGSLAGMSRGAKAARIASHAGAKVALPLATADLAAGVLAAKVMNKPKEKNVSKSISVDELFEKARGDKRNTAAGAAAGTAAGAAGGLAAGTASSRLGNLAGAAGVKVSNANQALKGKRKHDVFGRLRPLPNGGEKVVAAGNKVASGLHSAAGALRGKAVPVALVGGAAAAGAAGSAVGRKKKVSKSWDVVKFERETKRGAKTGAKWGAGINGAFGAASGAARGGAIGGPRGALMGAGMNGAVNAVSGGAIGGAVGAGVGAAKASARKDRDALVAAKPKKKVSKSMSVDDIFAVARGEVSFDA